MAEEKLDTTKELSDEELDSVAGGQIFRIQNGKYYVYDGGNAGMDGKYLCPNCGRPVHYGTAWRYYCDPCDKSWFMEDLLDINLSSGTWTELTRKEYKQLRRKMGLDTD